MIDLRSSLKPRFLQHSADSYRLSTVLCDGNSGNVFFPYGEFRGLDFVSALDDSFLLQEWLRAWIVIRVVLCKTSSPSQLLNLGLLWWLAGKFVGKKKNKNALSRFDKTSSTLHPELT